MRASLAQIGAILEEQGDSAGALEAYEKARAIDPNEVPANRIGAAARRGVAGPAARGVSRDPGHAGGDARRRGGAWLACGWSPGWRARVPAGGGHRHSRALGAAVDSRRRPCRRHGHAAELHVPARARGCAAAISRRRSRASWRSSRRRGPRGPRNGRAPASTIADLAPGHLSYPAVSQAVASGVMALDGRARSSCCGRSAARRLVDVIARLEALGKP